MPTNSVSGDIDAPPEQFLNDILNGIIMSNSLQKYASGDPSHFTLICDDVFTTGTSFKNFIDANYPMWTSAMGYRWVLFARKKSNIHPHHVNALFTMPG